jgi:hypothetical protein
MSSKIKSVIIFVSIALVVILVYVFFFKSAPKQPALTSTVTGGTAALPGISPSGANLGTDVNQEFLALLLNVKKIQLNDSIFTDSAFVTLRDSTITLISEGNEGRPNPFAPIGVDEGDQNALPNTSQAPPPSGGTSPIVQ